jgi:hypothetical protein
MSTSDQDQQMELLRGIATSLKGIHSSLESLTAAVEDVSETIEKAHEPEGDLGTHLVGALKDLVSALHKKAQQERSYQPQQNQQRQHQGRRDQQRHGQSRSENTRGEGIEEGEIDEIRDEESVSLSNQNQEENTAPQQPVQAVRKGPEGGGRNRRRGRKPGKGKNSGDSPESGAGSVPSGE